MISSESLWYLLNPYDIYDVFGIYNFSTRYYGIPIKSMTLWPLHEFPGFADGAERRNDGIWLKLVYKLELTTKACRNLYTSEQ